MANSVSSWQFPRVLKLVFVLGLLAYSMIIIFTFQKTISFRQTSISYFRENNLYKDVQVFEESVQDNKSINPKLYEVLEPALVNHDNDLKEEDSKENDIYQDALQVDGQYNPFEILGAYSNIDPEFLNSSSSGAYFQIIPQNDYCYRTDLYNLKNKENMFEKYNVYTDFPAASFPRKKMLNSIASMFSNQKNLNVTARTVSYSKYALDENITNFFMSSTRLQTFYRIGTEFLCATQMYNYVPGAENLVAKDKIVDRVNLYAEKFKDRPQCFNKKSLFPLSYRLHNEEECRKFFSIINSQEYRGRTKLQPVQYLLKVARNMHQANGVSLLGINEASSLNLEYNFGASCGQMDQQLLAQTYIANPLLLDRENKFDFRIYMLIASTNPMIVYYHDGFLRVSINAFDKFSDDKATHMTNTHLSSVRLEEAQKDNKTINGLDPEELKSYITWTFDRFQDYLLEKGRINDTNWLDNYLRPNFKKALIHLVRMTKDTLMAASNVYALHGVDFLMDEDMNLWFIESNPSPQLGGGNLKEINQIYYDLIYDQFEIQYSYYRSRMKRVLDVIKLMEEKSQEPGYASNKNLREMYKEAVKNRLEPEYSVSERNTFQLLIDENLVGAEAYFGLFPEQCVDK